MSRAQKINVLQSGIFASGALYMYITVLYLAFRLSCCYNGVAL